MKSNQKIKVAIMSYAMDNRRARGTALYTRKLVENFLEDDSLELSLVHYEKVDDPLYKRAREIIIPAPNVPSRFVRQLIFFWQYRNDTFDIIHWFQPRLYPFYWCAPARKIVATLHSAGDVTAPGAKIFSRRVFNFVLTYFHQWIHAAIAVSETARADIIKHYRFSAKRVYVTYNGGSEDYKRLDKSAAREIMAQKYAVHAPFILDVARPEPQKNLARLIESYEILRKVYGRSEKLVIVGGIRESYAEISDAARNSVYANDILFPGYIATEDLNALYAAADLFVFPSVDEGFGLPIIEAFASGTAVVTSNMSAPPEVAGGAALLVDPKSPENIADAMNNILSDDALRTALIEKGLARAKQFTWQATARQTTEIYQKILSL